MNIKYCPFCKDKFNSTHGMHIYHCCTDASLTKEQIRFLYIKYNFPELCIKNTIEKLYVTEFKSLPDISKMYNIDYKSILFLLTYFNITKRTSSDSCKIIAKPKREFTMLSRYGVKHNLQKDSPFFENRNNTIMKKYGVSNIFKDSDVKSAIKDKWYNGDTKNKRSKTMLDRHGYVNAFDNKTILIRALKNSSGKNSKLNILMINKLKLLGLSVESEFLIKENNKMYFYDIKINNTLIEINGDYWHGNPEIYKSSDYIKFPKNYPIKVSTLWKKDKIKKDIAINNNFKYIVVWEKDIRRNVDNVISNIMDKLKGDI